MKTYQDLEDFFLKNVEGGHEKKDMKKRIMKESQRIIGTATFVDLS